MSSPARLCRCDLRDCEAVCCYDGVYLLPGEEARIAAAVAADPEGFAHVPAEWAVDGSWRGRVEGRKTATRPHAYGPGKLPAHFTATRCVFVLEDGRCALQVSAEAGGLHPWALKPTACWMHPLRLGPDGRPRPPPRDPRHDEDRVEPDYPGYVTSTPCGRHRDDGEVWQNALAEELRYLRRGV